jgi:NAD(P)-dependent dehydrogenase (short-subunit alcohol dehydrogenase family)
MTLPTLLITGVSSGVGLSLVRHLSDRFHVIGLVRKLDAARESFKDLAHVSLYQVDVADQAALSACLDEVLSRHGSPSYLINNAGVNIAGSLEQLQRSDLELSLAVNFLAPALIMKRLLPAMKASNFGRIINITSGAPLNCFAGYAAYSASKAALNALTVTAAREHETLNIKINLMSPGPVRSNMAPNAPMDPSVCHPTVDYLLNLPADGPTGRFFWLGYEIPLAPDLEGVQWLEGKASDRFRKVL